MTKKHYCMIAAVLAETRQRYEFDDTALGCLEEVINELCIAFQKENPSRFNADTFQKVCIKKDQP